MLILSYFACFGYLFCSKNYLIFSPVYISILTPLIAEIKLGNNNSWLLWKYFDYDALSFRFQKILLNLLSKELDKSFNKYKNFLY